MKPTNRPAQHIGLTCFAVALLAVIGCGGKAIVDGAYAGAGGTAATGGTSSTGTSSADAGPDADLSPLLCEGDVAQVQLGDQRLSSVVVTTMEMPLMSCCQVNGVRLHTGGELGFDVVVVLRAWGNFEMGQHDVADPDGLIEAHVLNAPVSDLPWPEQNVLGTVEVLDPYGGDQPWHAGLCLRLDDSADGLHGVQLYVPSATLMPFAWWDRWGIWLLGDPGMDAVSAAALPLSALALQPYAALDVGAIAYYRQTSHAVGFGDIEGMIPALEQQLPPVGVNGVPFVVVADGDRIYLGAFMTQLSSVLFEGPTVMVEEIADQGFSILAPPQGADPRGDSRILQVMSEAGKLGG